MEALLRPKTYLPGESLVLMADEELRYIHQRDPFQPVILTNANPSIKSYSAERLALETLLRRREQDSNQ